MANGGNLSDAFGQFLKAIEDMNNTVLVPQRLVDIPEGNVPSLGSNCQCTKDMWPNERTKDLNGLGLYGTYQTLLEIREELTTGRETSATGCFGLHIQVVMETLRNLTWLAKSLTHFYCEEVCKELPRMDPTITSFVDLEELERFNELNSKLKALQNGRRKSVS